MRCANCQKRCPIVDVFECKLCEEEYCYLCRLPEEHACVGLREKIEHDRDELSKSLPKCVPKKL
jgi:predicted nucleic acid binding AN1-type Zn finger protein